MADKRDDFYCRYGNHWKSKLEKIPTIRQGNYICAECEEKRSLNTSKNSKRNRRFSDMIDNIHRLTLFNYDLIVSWHIEHDLIKITEVNIIHNNEHNLINFLSGKVFKLIIADIDKYELNKQ
jgi:hypothetical protein